MASGIIDPTKKTALLNAIKAKDCISARYIRQNLIYWEDATKILFQFSDTFDCDPSYLDDILSIFTDSELTDQGIYYLKSSTTIINPSWVVKGSGLMIQVGTGMEYKELHIAYSSTVTEIVISDDVPLDVIAIGSSSVVDKISGDNGGPIDVLVVKSCIPDVASPVTGLPSTLGLISEGTVVNNLDISSGSSFGGYECNIDET